MGLGDVGTKRVFDALAATVEGHEDRTVTQAALQFVMSKGCMPIPGVTNAVVVIISMSATVSINFDDMIND